MVSAVIVTSAKNIDNLFALQRKLSEITDETVVIADNSDKTILRELQCCFGRVISLPGKGTFEDYYPDILKYAEYEWILRLDDDEMLNENWTRDKIIRLTENKSATKYWFPRRWVAGSEQKEYICTEPWFPDYQMRLFRNIQGIITLPEKIHEVCTVAGSELRIDNLFIDHYDLVFNSFEERLKKTARYRSLEPYNCCEKYYLYERYNPDTAPLLLNTKSENQFGFIITDIQMPEKLYFDNNYTVKMRVYNLSCRTIHANGNIFLSYHIFDADKKIVLQDGLRTPFPQELQTGESIEVLVKISAPLYELDGFVQFDAVEEGVTWFSQHNAGEKFPLTGLSVRNNFGETTENLKKAQKIFYLMTPEHGNIGDHAIQLGGQKFLEEQFSGYFIIELSSTDLSGEKRKEWFGYIGSILNPQDLFFLNGGGNLGNVYLGEETLRREIIQTFKDNYTVVLPQTVYFTEDKDGRNETAVSAETYNRGNLLLCARDTVSLEYMKTHFKNCNKTLCPDMFLYSLIQYNTIQYNTTQHNTTQYNTIQYILLLFRNDTEKKKTSDVSSVLEILREIGLSANIDDLNYDRDGKWIVIEKEIRDIYVNLKLNAVKQSKLVITDRFHGMLLSFACNRPCIVLPSLGHKIPSARHFFANVPSIRFLSEINGDFPSVVKEMLDVEVNNDFNMFSQYFENLKQLINDMISK
jgi:pyruvyl transferase EpsI